MKHDPGSEISSKRTSNFTSGFTSYTSKVGVYKGKRKVAPVPHYDSLATKPKHSSITY
jgi:hypothetical protein